MKPDGGPDAVPGVAGGTVVIVGAVIVGLVFLLVGLGSGSESADLVLLPEFPVSGPQTPVLMQEF